MMVDMSSEESDPEDENSMLVRSLPWRASLVDKFYDSLDSQMNPVDHLSRFVSLNIVHKVNRPLDRSHLTSQSGHVSHPRSKNRIYTNNTFYYEQ